MKRTILTGVLAMAAGLSSLWAQAPAAPAAQAAPAAPAAPAPPKAKSAAEQKAYNAVVTAIRANDADGIIKASEELMAKYADTDFKELALSAEAQSYRDKKDDVNAQVFAERALQINPKNVQMELLDGEIILPTIKEHDLDHDQKVAKVGQLFNGAIEGIKATAKPNPQESDADWAETQKAVIAQAHQDLGLLSQIQKKWDDAIKEFQLAIDGDPLNDTYSARLAFAYYAGGKLPDALALCDKILAKPNLNQQIKDYVTRIKNASTPKK